VAKRVKEVITFFSGVEFKVPIHEGEDGEDIAGRPIINRRFTTVQNRETEKKYKLVRVDEDEDEEDEDEVESVTRRDTIEI